MLVGSGLASMLVQPPALGERANQAPLQARPFSSVRVSAEELGEAALLEFSIRDSENGVDQCLVCDFESDAVHLEEHESCGCASSLVAVHKRMVPDDVKEVRCGHLKEVSVKVLGAGSCLRHSESGL